MNDGCKVTPSDIWRLSDSMEFLKPRMYNKKYKNT